MLPMKRKLIQKKYLIELKLIKKIILLKNGYNLNAITENSLHRWLNTVLKYFPISSKKMIDIFDKKYKKRISMVNKYYIEKNDMFKNGFSFPIDWFEELVNLPFEDTNFKAPKEYDKYLKRAYGNYMEYPSEKEREKGHSLTNVVIENEYDSYFKNNLNF